MPRRPRRPRRQAREQLSAGASLPTGNAARPRQRCFSAQAPTTAEPPPLSLPFYLAATVGGEPVGALRAADAERLQRRGRARAKPATVGPRARGNTEGPQLDSRGPSW